MKKVISTQVFDPNVHYPIVQDWWQKSGWGVSMPLSHLPTLGIVVYLDEKPAAVGWIFQTDSAFCWLSFVVADPEVRNQERAEVLSHLIEESKVAAKNMGYKIILASFKNGSLISRLEKHGFKSTEKHMTNLTFNIGAS